MERKIKIIVAIVIILIITAVVVFSVYKNNKTENIKVGDGKVLVVYYSAQNHTKSVAEEIAKNLNADTFEIIPEDVYSSSDLDWTDKNSRVSKEHDNKSLRDIKLKTTDVEN